MPDAETWPSLPLEPWRETYAALHLWTQIVGKVRLAQTPWINHSWHVTLYPTAAGLTTSPIPYGTRVFQLDASKLPRYAGAANERGGFSIYKLVSVTTPPLNDPKRIETANARLSEQIGRELFNAYVAALKADADVKINQEALEKK